MKKNKNDHYQDVIKPTSITPWGFRCYLDLKGNDVIDEWKLTLSKKGKANYDSILKILKDQPKENWLRPKAVAIGHNIFVIHFKDENRSQYRPTGNFLDIYNSFVITTKVIEKDGNYIPSNYAAIAAKRRDEVNNNPDRRSTPCFAHVSTPFIANKYPNRLVR